LIKKYIVPLLVLTYFSNFIASEDGVYFINIKNGDSIKSPVFIQFGLSGKGVAPAGVPMENTGHHHLLINVNDLDLSKPIPASKNHLHFGGGQTEAFIDLPLGEHQLQLIFGDMYHIPHSKPLISEKITVIVK
tara:strand:+ start:122 stop:520 length:399 start_codon:yes stop_codon:yes gene_type:complete